MTTNVFAVSRTGAPAQRGWVRAWRLLRTCVRVDEVLVLQGSPMLGSLFSIGKPSFEWVPALALFAAGSCCLVAHVFVLNDWAGMSADLRDPNRARRVFATEGVPPRAMRHLSVVLLLLAVLLLGPFGARTLAIALAIVALSALYSLHRPPAKGVPVVGSLLHVAGGMLHFHLGYSLSGTFDATSLALSAFFGLTFAAGHLTQEARDYDADRFNGIRTNAVTFGRTAAFVTGLSLFALADAVLLTMALFDVIPWTLAVAAPLFLLHLGWSLQTLLAGLTFDSIQRLRRRYRALYVVIGVLMLAAILAR